MLWLINFKQFMVNKFNIYTHHFLVIIPSFSHFHCMANHGLRNKKNEIKILKHTFMALLVVLKFLMLSHENMCLFMHNDNQASYVVYVLEVWKMAQRVHNQYRFDVYYTIEVWKMTQLFHNQNSSNV